jgi:hypothetical protein
MVIPVPADAPGTCWDRNAAASDGVPVLRAVHRRRGPHVPVPRYRPAHPRLPGAGVPHRAWHFPMLPQPPCIAL